MARDDWSDAQNDLIVEDYFSMWRDRLSGVAVIKSHRNAALQPRLGRSHGAIEFKHRNISAVLKGAGDDWLPGYVPAEAYQASLEDAVERWMARHPEWTDWKTEHQLSGATPGAGAGPGAGLQEAPILFPRAAPTQRNAPPPENLAQMQATAARFDAAERDARNRALGEAGEKLALDHERRSLRAQGREDLAHQVRWTSREEGDGAGYDIASFDPEGRPRLLEVKTTNGWERTPFHISRNEIRVAEARREEWVLFRLHSFSRKPGLFEIRPPLDAHVSLTPTSFLASFG